MRISTEYDVDQSTEGNPDRRDSNDILLDTQNPKQWAAMFEWGKYLVMVCTLTHTDYIQLVMIKSFTA